MMRERVRRAQEKLRHDPGRSITDTAMDLGLASSQDFARIFRRQTGVAPRVFRKRMKNLGEQGRQRGV
jgi:AraC-like DNA-binding protein